MRKTFKITGMSILGLIGLISVYMISTYCLSRITVTEEKGNKQEVTIYIKTNGVHTDLVVPIRTNQMDWSKEVRFSNTLSADTTFTYLAMGWGDKGFYLETPTWADLKTSVAFKAATGLSTTAIHATYYPAMKEDSDCVKIKISREQYARLIKYIDDSFRKDANGHVINIKTNANYGKTDAFYEAKGRYSLFHTCNSWANAGLKACGQRACLWTAFDTGIFLKYK
ncbi:MAG: TIGR02117 family protein [Paludibacter sp.]|nr:TIGR02117 family protein [Paludibacter sp.]